MDFYAVVSDGDFLQYYPNNTPNDFRIHLPRMNLKGQWYVGLCETTLTVDRNCEVCIFLDICGDTLINGEKKPLLRRLNLQSGQNDVEFKHVMYIPIVTNDFYSLRIFLEAQTILQPSSKFVLHFKRYPFF